MDWKRIFLRAVGFGAGFAVSLAIILGIAVWYGSRPRPPKPWDNKTIQSEYGGTTGEPMSQLPAGGALAQSTPGVPPGVPPGATLLSSADPVTTDIGFRYVLTNNGIEDYRISDSNSVQLSIVASNGELTPPNRVVSIETPVFVPSGHKAMVFIKMRTGTRFQHQLPEHATSAEKEQYRKAVLDYLNGLHVAGFALFDEGHRTEIDFPGGW